MIFQIIYTSAALPCATTADFKEIAIHAQQNNDTLNVTGILLFSDGVIFQVLEGERRVVETLYDRIKRDPRHSSIVKMVSRSTDTREFSAWSMGFAEMNYAHVSELAFLLTKDSLANALPQNPSAELSVLSNTYARVNGL